MESNADDKFLFSVWPVALGASYRPNSFMRRRDNEIMYFFTADEHYGHSNIIRYCNRPFTNVTEMDSILIKNFNSKVSKNDTTIHAGDFCWFKRYIEKNSNDCVFSYISQLNGNHVFLKGSHDAWLPRNKSIQIWEGMIRNHYVVICHYAMRVWARSHYNSLHLFGHSHGKLEPIGKSHDIGVDNNNFYPVSEEEIIEIMKSRPDNPNLVKRQ